MSDRLEALIVGVHEEIRRLDKRLSKNLGLNNRALRLVNTRLTAIENRFYDGAASPRTARRRKRRAR